MYVATRLGWKERLSLLFVSDVSKRAFRLLLTILALNLLEEAAIMEGVGPDAAVACFA